MRRRRWLRPLLLLTLLIGAFIALRAALTTRAARTDFRIATVERGPIAQMVTAAGLVVPAFEQQLNAPVSTEIRRVLLPTGTQVNTGDLILELDQEYVQLDLDARRNHLELRRNNIQLLRLEYDKDLRELDYNDGIKALELASAESAVADAQRLAKIGGVPQEAVDEARLRLGIIQLEKKKLENELAYRRASLAGRKRNLELEVEVQEKEVRELSRKLKETQLRAPQPGVITWINESIGEKVAEGAPLVRLANLQHFRIEASCSDRYAGQVKVGLPIVAHVNNDRLPGTITTILPSVENNTLAFIVELDQSDHPRLRPNMRVDVDIITDRRADVLRVPNGPAFNGAQRQSLFVLQGGEARRVEVGIGLTNADYVEITDAAVAPGDRVIISDMRSYEHLDRIVLKP